MTTFLLGHTNTLLYCRYLAMLGLPHYAQSIIFITLKRPLTIQRIPRAVKTLGQKAIDKSRSQEPPLWGLLTVWGWGWAHRIHQSSI